MSKDDELGRKWKSDEGVIFKLEVERLEVKKPEKRKTRLCVDCSTTILDDDGEIKAHYGTFIEVEPKGRKVERCADCDRKHRKKYHKEYQREKRAKARKERAKRTPPMRWHKCPQYDECLTEAAIASKEFSCESCETFLASHPVNKNR
jgi:hypothetical protein